VAVPQQVPVYLPQRGVITHHPPWRGVGEGAVGVGGAGTVVLPPQPKEVVVVRWCVACAASPPARQRKRMVLCRCAGSAPATRLPVATFRYKCADAQTVRERTYGWR